MSKKSKSVKPSAAAVEIGIADPGTNAVPAVPAWSMATSKHKPKRYQLSLKGKFGELLEGGLGEVLGTPSSAGSNLLTSQGAFFTRDMLSIMYGSDIAGLLDRKEKDRIGPLPDAMKAVALELEAAGVGTVMHGVLTRVHTPSKELMSRLVAEETNMPYVDLIAVPRDLEVSKKEFLSLSVEGLVRLSVRRRVRNSTRHSYKSKAAFLKGLIDDQSPVPIPATAEQTQKFMDIMNFLTTRFVLTASQFLDEYEASTPVEKTCSHCGGTGKVKLAKDHSYFR